jgi:hypothetical protein
MYRYLRTKLKWYSIPFRMDPKRKRHQFKRRFHSLRSFIIHDLHLFSGFCLFFILPADLVFFLSLLPVESSFLKKREYSQRWNRATACNRKISPWNRSIFMQNTIEIICNIENLLYKSADSHTKESLNIYAEHHRDHM